MYQLHDSIVRACGLEVEAIRRNAATSKECMDKQTHTHLLQQHSAQQRQKAADTALVRARKEVEINGSGTSGYCIKEGEHRGTVVGHIKRDTPTI